MKKFIVLVLFMSLGIAKFGLPDFLFGSKNVSKINGHDSIETKESSLTIDDVKPTKKTIVKKKNQTVFNDIGQRHDKPRRVDYRPVALTSANLELAKRLREETFDDYELFEILKEGNHSEVLSLALHQLFNRELSEDQLDELKTQVKAIGGSTLVNASLELMKRKLIQGQEKEEFIKSAISDDYLTALSMTNKLSRTQVGSAVINRLMPEYCRYEKIVDEELHKRLMNRLRLQGVALGISPKTLNSSCSSI